MSPKYINIKPIGEKMQFRKFIKVLVLISVVAFVQPDAQANDEGFIYGKVITKSGETYTGTLRWGKQECFWDDIFNATKDDNPWLKYIKKGDKSRSREPEIDIFGITIHKFGGIAGAHLFITRFGDIESIKVRYKEDATIFMKNGSEYDVTGYGDVGVSILIMDENLGKIKLKWKNIKTIEFLPTPKKVLKEGYRLKGKVKSHEMDFEGYVMWDAEECISSDILDGDSEDGDMEIEFGNIRSIKRQSRKSCLVTLKDGREFSLQGTNDVNSDNRGIYVADERFGKIEIQWDEFKEVIYEDEDDSGKSYDSYKPKSKLEGMVKTIGGDEFRGIIVFDLDESEGFEILNGKLDDMEFNIPFFMIASITPKGRHSSIVKLHNGEELRLEDSQDVSDSHDGILIFPEKGKPDYIEWEELETIVFNQ